MVLQVCNTNFIYFIFKIVLKIKTFESTPSNPNNFSFFQLEIKNCLHLEITKINVAIERKNSIISFEKFPPSSSFF